MTEISRLHGYVLHARSYRETSSILDVFTAETGRVSVLVRGARSSRSKVKAFLQPFIPLQLELFGRSSLKTAKLIEPDGPYGALTGPALLSGLYLNELLIYLLAQNDACQPLFTVYTQTLSALARPEPIEPHLRRFELLLLTYLGYGLHFQEEGSEGKPIDEAAYYRYISQAGFERIHAQTGSQKGLFLGKDLLAMGTLTFDSPEVLKAAKRLLRQAITDVLAGKPLMSRELFYQGGRYASANTSRG